MSFQRLLKSVARDMLPLAGLDFRTQSGLHLFVPDRGAWSSSSEVFFARIYDPFFPHLNGVRQWIDLGCNHGFFSFALLDHLFRQGNGLPATQVFLADANEVCVARVRAAIGHNRLQAGWRCDHVVVGPPGARVRFQQHKDSLHSNIFNHGRGRKRALEYTTTDLTEKFSRETGLFDLVKIDIEGAEQFLFEHQLTFLKRFRFGLCEWHSPAFAGPKLEARLRELGWPVLALRSQAVEYDLRAGDSWASPLGMVLWENPAPAG